MTEWDDFWIIYRDREEYAQGREAWAKEMNKKGKWPQAEALPGVAERNAYDKPKIEVEKDRWPREKVVMRQKGSDLGDALREKIGKWGYEPEGLLRLLPRLRQRQDLLRLAQKTDSAQGLRHRGRANQ